MPQKMLNLLKDLVSKVIQQLNSSQKDQPLLKNLVVEELLILLFSKWYHDVASPSFL
jgi:hypothetical protein